jgi:hypothetical protein
MTDEKSPEDIATEVPALFATIHFQGPGRPDGYTPEEIAELNELANRNAEPFDE